MTLSSKSVRKPQWVLGKSLRRSNAVMDKSGIRGISEGMDQDGREGMVRMAGQTGRWEQRQGKG